MREQKTGTKQYLKEILGKIEKINQIKRKKYCRRYSYRLPLVKKNISDSTDAFQASLVC